ncbi:MAG: vanadium-dependent haloperoxidase [Longimicrobiales bacterium]
MRGSKFRKGILAALATVAVSATGCQQDIMQPAEPGEPQATVLHFKEKVHASTTWNDRGRALLGALPNGSHAPAIRILTYLSVAQYRAALAAEKSQRHDAGRGRWEFWRRPSVSAAVGAASVAVLSSFFPAQAANLEVMLQADLDEEERFFAKFLDEEAGVAIGREVGGSVITLALTDGVNTVSPGTPPVGPGYWVSSSAPIVRALYGARPFFMRSGDQLRAPPPPAFGSAPFLTDLAEVRAISDTRTPEQLALAVEMNHLTAPFTPGNWNALAVQLIRDGHGSEREAARILAYSNAAAFDAMIACWESKFAYWYIRPSQADPAITLPIGLPNHPSYPSGHSCITSALLTVLMDEFPREKRELATLIEKAGLSRVYAGIHYRFDLVAGKEIGRRAAQLALRGGLE